MRLSNKQVAYLNKERNRIIRFAQELREMAGDENYYFGAKCHEAADSLVEGCFMIDDVLLEGSVDEDN